MSGPLLVWWLGATDLGVNIVPVEATAERLRSEAGVEEAVAYTVADGSHMKRLRKRLHRMESGDFSPGLAKSDQMLIVRLGTIEDAWRLQPTLKRLAGTMEKETGWTPLLKVLYQPILTVPGADANGRGTLSPVVQLGTYSLRSPSDDWALTDWYQSVKLPAFQANVGGIRATRLVSVCGPMKHGILYEFSSREARQQSFEPEEFQGIEPGSSYFTMDERILHAPMSPTVGWRH